jgi:dTDP-glucose 4,6-dehydratase
MAYYHTYGLPVNITNCSNNYGPRQHGEKFIPKVIKNILNDKKIPVYGDGNQIRDWLYVLDHCSALVNVWRNGRVGEKYNIGSGCEISNIDLVRKILEYFKKDDSMIEFVPDRLGHDRRYSTDFTKINQELGWSPTHNLDIGLQKTISWYENRKNKI